MIRGHIISCFYIAHLSWHLRIFGGESNNLKFLLILCKNMHFVSIVPFTRLTNHKKHSSYAADNMKHV